jgi:hypothetical protein
VGVPHGVPHDAALGRGALLIGPPARGTRRDAAAGGAALVIDAGTADDVVSLALTLLLCAVLTVGVLMWGGTDSARR